MESKSKRPRSPILKIAVEFLILVIGLGVYAIFMQHKITHLLNMTMEQIVARQAADIANLAENQLRQKLTILHYTAEQLEISPGHTNEILGMYTTPSSRDGSVGTISVDGSHIGGEKLPDHVFPRISRAARGEDAVAYAPGKGLLLAVPVYAGDNVRGILWRICDKKVNEEQFTLVDYKSDFHYVLLAHDGQTIVPYKLNPEEEELSLSDSSIQEGFDDLRARLETSSSAARYTECPQGRIFLFGADLPESNCTLQGYVSWDAVAGDIARIYQWILHAGSFLLFLLVALSVYLFTVQLKAEESDALRREKEVSERTSQAKSAFLANMSHEIRTPINSILGMNEMILREVQRGAVRGYAQSIARAGEALLSIINDILDFSKIESGKLEIVESEYRLSHLLKNIVAMIRPRAEEKGLTFNLHIDEDLPNVLIGDIMRLQQVIINLLTNAVKYTPEGEVNFFVMKERLEENHIYLSFVVNDTGIGIKEEDQQKLFQDFERLDQEKNRNIEGTGLGLAIASMLLKLMGGTIELKSVYGEGSTFTVILPQTIVERSPIGNLAEQINDTVTQTDRYIPAFTAPDAHVLVVDDNEMNLHVVKGLLKETKMQIDTCMSGLDCLRMLTEKSYDLVLLDHMMPEMDGVETLHHAQQLPNTENIPFIMLTANAISGVKEGFLKEGFAAYLSKPIDSALMEETLMKFLPKEKLMDGPSPDEIAAAQETPPGFAGDNLDGDQDNSTGDLDIEQGMKYNGGMEDMYKTVLGMFINLRPGKQKQMKEYLDAEDWKNYATMLHALKSTSMTIGGQKLSDAAKELELAGKKCCAEDSTEEEIQESSWYIRSHHERTMALYDKLAQDAERWLNQNDGT